MSNKDKKISKEVKQKEKSKQNILPISNRSVIYIYLILILLIGAITCTTHFDKKLSLNGDNAGYIILGKSILQGRYDKINRPGEPVPFTKWPPGLPFLLAISELISSNNFVLMKVMVLLMSLGSAVLFFFICRHYFINFISFLIALFFIVNANIVEYSHYILSETPFMFFLLLGIFFFLKRDKIKGFRDINFLLSLITISLSTYFRTAGVAVIGALLFIILWEALKSRRFKGLVISILVVILIISPWMIRNRIVGGKNLHNQYQYIKVNPYRPELGNIDFKGFLKRYYDNFNSYAFREIPLCIITNFRSLYSNNIGLANTLAVILLLLIILGIIASLFDNEFRIFSVIIILFIIMTFYIPPVWATIRLVLPILPFFILILFYSFKFIIKKLLKSASTVNYLIGISLMILFLFNVTGLNLLKASIKDYPSNWRNYYKCAQWIKNNTDKDTVICCRKPHLFYLWSDRQTVVYAKTPDTEKVMDSISKHDAKYIILAQLGFSDTNRYLYPAIQKNSDKFVVKYYLKNPDTYILEYR
jgi:4-amino-4-deoxy-L-arabinose transferase-like glycosyltransferase